MGVTSCLRVAISASNGFVLAATIAPALYGNYMALGFGSYKYYARGLQDE